MISRSLYLFTLSLVLGVLCLLQPACSSTSTSSAADPAQVAKISAVAGMVVQGGVAITLQEHPELKPELLAVAEAIEQAAALPNAPEPSNLVNLASAVATKFGGPYGALAGIGVEAGFALYQQLYAANASSALDKQPAFKAVLTAMASGIRAAANGAPSAPAAPPALTPDELVLRPSR